MRHLVAAIVCVSGVVLVASCNRSESDTGDAGTSESPETPVASMTEREREARAKQLAEQLLEACGGREAWVNAQYITFKYFNGRRHTWDRQRNLLRLDMPSPIDRPNGVLLNLSADTINAWNGGAPVTDPLRLTEFHASAKQMFENDIVWLFLPYLLLDPPYTIRFLGRGQTIDGHAADKIDVFYTGETPAQSRHYVIYLDPESHLIKQWDFFSRVMDPDPQIVCRWQDWQEIDGLLISTYRGVIEEREVRFSDIAVFDYLPDTVFTEFLPVPEFIRNFKNNEQPPGG